MGQKLYTPCLYGENWLSAITIISKAPGLPTAPVVSSNRYQRGGQYSIHGPRLLKFLQGMRQQVLAPYDTLTVGEAYGATTAEAVELTNPQSELLNMVFHSRS